MDGVASKVRLPSPPDTGDRGSTRKRIGLGKIIHYVTCSPDQERYN